MKKQKSPVFLKIGVIVVLLALTAALFAFFLFKAITTSPLFCIQEVVYNEESGAVDLAHLKGRNIFAVNLREEAQYLSRNYTSYSTVRIVRILPNRIFVDFLKRKPVAQVRLSRPFYVDKEGVLFDMGETVSVPLIIGLEGRIPSPLAGRQYRIKELVRALMCIDEFAGNDFLRTFSLKKIVVSTPSVLTVFMSVAGPSVNEMKGGVSSGAEEIEVRIDANTIKQKVALLANVLKHVNVSPANISYIDLRFNEPVVKFKEEGATSR